MFPTTPDLKTRPIRDLVSPDLEKPIEGRRGKEKRRANRYSHTLPAILLTRDGEHPSTAVDIGYGGMQLFTPDHLPLDIGQPVMVRMRRGEERFGDAMFVRSFTATELGTEIHLGM